MAMLWRLDYSKTELATIAEIYGFVKANPLFPTTGYTDLAGMNRNEIWLTSYPEPIEFIYNPSVADVDLPVGLRTAYPAVISRSAITWTLDARDTSVEVTVQGIGGAAQKLLAAMNNNYRMLIMLQDITNPLYNDYVFYGEGVPTVFSGDAVVIKARADRGALDMLLPDIVFQKQCNNILFDARCGLSVAQWAITIPYKEIEEAGAGMWYHPAIEAQTDNWFWLGQVIVGDWATSKERRMITSSSNGIIYFSPSFERALDDNEQIVITPGCDKTIGTCISKFGNRNKFFGMPELPTKNPSTSGMF